MPLHLRETAPTGLARCLVRNLCCIVQDAFPILPAGAPSCCSSTLLPVVFSDSGSLRLFSSLRFSWLSGEPSYPYLFPSIVAPSIAAQFHHGIIPIRYLKYLLWLRQ